MIVTTELRGRKESYDVPDWFGNMNIGDTIKTTSGVHYVKISTTKLQEAELIGEFYEPKSGAIIYEMGKHVARDKKDIGF